MKMSIKMKNGKKYFYSEAQSQKIARGMNYIKLFQILSGGAKNANDQSTIKILDQTFKVMNIKSFEFFL